MFHSVKLVIGSQENIFMMMKKSRSLGNKEYDFLKKVIKTTQDTGYNPPERIACLRGFISIFCKFYLDISLKLLSLAMFWL